MYGSDGKSQSREGWILRIAVFHNLPTGGAKRVLHGFVSYLVESGNSVDVFVPSTAREDFLPLKDVGANVTFFPVQRTISGSLYSLLRYTPMEISLGDLERTEREIAEAINNRDYDVVLCEQDRYTMSPFFLKYVRKPTVYFCQQPSRYNEQVLRRLSKNAIRTDNLSPPRKWIRRQFAKRIPRIDKKNAIHSKYILVNSNFSKESVLRSYGMDAQVCYLGVDTDLFKPSGAPRESFVLSVGECNPGKGFDFLIRSLALIDSNARPKLRLICNSFSPGWREYIEQLAEEKGVYVEIMSLVGDDELVSAYNRAQLLLCAAYNEPFGLTPVEAMACGTPVVAVKEGGFVESVLDKETGLMTVRSEEEFSKAISDLLVNKEQRLSMGRRGVEVVRRQWTMKHAGKRLLDHLERAAASSETR